jgi:hypothetical protein
MMAQPLAISSTTCSTCTGSIINSTLYNTSLPIYFSPSVIAYCSLYMSTCDRFYAYESVDDCLVNATKYLGHSHFPNEQTGDHLECRYYQLLQVADFEFDSRSRVCSDTGINSTELCVDPSTLTPTCYFYCSRLEYACPNQYHPQCISICQVGTTSLLECRYQRILTAVSLPSTNNCLAAALIATDGNGTQCSSQVESYCDTIMTSCGKLYEDNEATSLTTNTDMFFLLKAPASIVVSTFGQFVSRNECLTIASWYSHSSDYNINNRIDDDSIECRQRYVSLSWEWPEQCRNASVYSYGACTDSVVRVSNVTNITAPDYGHGCDNHCQMIFATCGNVHTISASPSDNISVVLTWGGSLSDCIEICRYLPMNTTEPANQLTFVAYNHSMNCRSYWARSTLLSSNESWVNATCEGSTLANGIAAVGSTEIISVSNDIDSLFYTGSNLNAWMPCGSPCVTYCQLYSSICEASVTRFGIVSSSSLTFYSSYEECIEECNSHVYSLQIGAAASTDDDMSPALQLQRRMRWLIRAARHLTWLVTDTRTNLTTTAATKTSFLKQCRYAYDYGEVEEDSPSIWTANFIGWAIVLPVLGAIIFSLCIYNRWKMTRANSDDEPPPVLAEVGELNRDLNGQTPEALEMAAQESRAAQIEQAQEEKALADHNDGELDRAVAASVAEFNASTAAVAAYNGPSIHDTPHLLDAPLPRIVSIATVGAVLAAPTVTPTSGASAGAGSGGAYIVSPSLMDPADAAAALAAAQQSPMALPIRSSTPSNTTDDGSPPQTPVAGDGGSSASSSSSISSATSSTGLLHRANEATRASGSITDEKGNGNGTTGGQTSPYGCCICYERAADHCVLDCGHLCMCRRCVGLLLQSGGLSSRRCPKCRAPILRIVRIYV